METYKQYTWWLKALSGADEVQARRFAGAIALEIGWGGITKVEELTGMSHSTINKGIEELKTSEKLEPPERLRASGGGRKKVEEKNPGILNDLEKIMDENTSGDPMSLLKWTNKSTYKIADELRNLQHKIDPDTVGRLLKENDYSLQANKKNIEGSSVPERDAQFRYINEQAKEFINQGYPVISVDAKKKENVGEFKNPGRTWTKKGQAKEVNVGISYDTSEFAVESIRQWWLMFGRNNYPNAKGLMICADGGGSNGSRNKGWKFHLQELVNQIKVPITVCHYPPGTSKWNKIEHCRFSFITMNWKGKPLVSFETMIKLISGTKTKKGLTVASRLDEKKYTKGIKILDEEMDKLQIEYHSLHPKWNYSISPKGD